MLLRPKHPYRQTPSGIQSGHSVGSTAYRLEPWKIALWVGFKLHLSGKLPFAMSLFSAVQTGNVDEVSLLLHRHGSNLCLEQTEPHGHTVVHIAVRARHVVILQILCQHCKIFLPDYHGNTALHFAAACGSVAMVKMLLDHGVQASFRNRQHLTALDTHILMAQRDDPRLAYMLLEKTQGLDFTASLHRAVDRKLLNIAGALVEVGANLMAPDCNGFSIYQKLPSAELLIQHIRHPPPTVSRSKHCQRCAVRIGFGHRTRCCAHCKRHCCTECACFLMPADQFPPTFRLSNAQRVCKTCHAILLKPPN